MMCTSKPRDPTRSHSEGHVTFMFTNNASHLRRSYGTRVKSASAIFGVVKRFVGDMGNMGVPRAVRTDNGAEYTITVTTSESAAS